MAYTIFDAGFLDWFENRHLTATFSDLLGTFNHTASQVWDVTKSDVAPGLAAFCRSVITMLLWGRQLLVNRQKRCG